MIDNLTRSLDMTRYIRHIIMHNDAIVEVLNARRPFSIIDTRTTRFMEAS